MMIEPEHTIVAFNAVRCTGWPDNIASTAPSVTQRLQLFWNNVANITIRFERCFRVRYPKDRKAKLLLYSFRTAFCKDDFATRDNAWIRKASEEKERDCQHEKEQADQWNDEM
jgi:hypothetical protein